MLVMFKNSFYRMLKEKSFLILSTIFTIIAMAAAIILTNKAVIKANIAIVGSEASIEGSGETEMFDISYLDEEPRESELVEGRYDAIIKFNKDKTFEINTVKDDKFKDKLTSVLNKEVGDQGIDEDRRGVGSSIIGFMMMFVLLQGVVYSKLLSEDREKHMTERILVSPINFSKYLWGYGLFSFGLIMVPTMLVIIVADFLGVNIGFSIFQYFILISILSLLSTSFGLCINSFFKDSDTPGMLGNVIVILTSILAGSFFSISDEEFIFDKLVYILPQKDFISFTAAFEGGTVDFGYNLQILYVILISVVLLLIGVFKMKKDYKYKIN